LPTTRRADARCSILAASKEQVKDKLVRRLQKLEYAVTVETPAA
jgi:hypothetical protein